MLSFSHPPVSTLCGNEVVAPLRGKLTIGDGNHEVKLVSKGLVSNLPAPIRFATARLELGHQTFWL